MTPKEIMSRTIKLAENNVRDGMWPFSTIITRNGEIIAEAVNSVLKTFDPSDHAEIAAIRIATKKLQSTDLSDCEMYVVGLPCPMCLTCIIFSNLPKVIYAVDVNAKDKSLQSLPLTDSLYKLIADDYGAKAVSYEHLCEFSREGEKLFVAWDRDNSKK